MPAYVISYDLVQPNRNYEPLYTRIKLFGTWARVTESTWIIVSDRTAIDIRDELIRVIDANDRIFVLKSGLEAAWQNVRCKNEWLRKHL